MKTIPICALVLAAATAYGVEQVTPVADPAAPSSTTVPMPTPLTPVPEGAKPQAEPVVHTPENARPGPALTALDPVSTSGAIMAWMFDARDQQAAALEMRIEATARAVEALKVSAGDYRTEAPFRAATLAVSAAEEQLRRSIKMARAATAEKWTDARAKVSSDFKAYADAVTKTEGMVAANGQPNA